MANVRTRRRPTGRATQRAHRASHGPIETQPSCARASAQSGPGRRAWRRPWPPATNLLSILHELVSDGPPQEPPGRGNRRPDVGARVIGPPEAIHFTEPGHRLFRPAVDVSPFIGHAK